LTKRKNNPQPSGTNGATVSYEAKLWQMANALRGSMYAAKYARAKEKFKGEALDARLNKTAGQRFHNHSPLDFEKLKGDPDHIAQHLVS
jgi:hypothetical protein